MLSEEEQIKLLAAVSLINEENASKLILDPMTNKSPDYIDEMLKISDGFMETIVINVEVINEYLKQEAHRSLEESELIFIREALAIAGGKELHHELENIVKKNKQDKMQKAPAFTPLLSVKEHVWKIEENERRLKQETKPRGRNQP